MVVAVFFFGCGLAGLGIADVHLVRGLVGGLFSGLIGRRHLVFCVCDIGRGGSDGIFDNEKRRKRTRLREKDKDLLWCLRLQ